MKTVDFDILPEHRKIVDAILLQHLMPNTTVWIFGSRVQKAKKKFSDLDLIIDYPNQPIPISIWLALTEAFSESDLPYKVDLIDWQTVSPEFKQSIFDKKKLYLSV